jgi:DNA-binding MarR family transcriptional regulator
LRLAIDQAVRTPSQPVQVSLHPADRKTPLDNIRYNKYILEVAGRLQKELKQTRPFACKEEEVHLNIIRTAEWLSSAFSETLKSAADLTPTQYNALRILRGAGEEGLSCSQISERMVTKDSDITRLLDRLESRGLISRERESKDRRVIIARITEGGLRTLAELDKPIQEHHRRLLKHMGEKELANLSTLLEQARKSAD